MRILKLRLLTMGCIIAALGVILSVTRGLSVPIEVLVGAGLVLFIAGLLMK